MSKVSYEPNNTKNGHLGAKLEPIENRKFPKNRFHTPILSVWEALLKLHTVKIEPPAHLLQWILKMKNEGFSVFFDVFSGF